MGETRVRLHVTGIDGTRRTLSAKAGIPLMQALKNEDLVAAVCGGMCSCGTCHVRLAPAWQEVCGVPDAVERDLLGALEAFGEGSRLSCQISLTAEVDGLEIEILPEE